MSKQIKAPRVGGMVIEGFSGYFLIACLILSFLLLFKVFESFIVILLFAGIIATAFHPLYDQMLKVLKGKEKLASFLTCLLVLVIIVVPISVFLLFLGKQAFEAYKYLHDQFQTGVLDQFLKWQPGGTVYDSLAFVRQQFGSVIDFDSLNIKGTLMEAVKSVTSQLASLSAFILKEFGFFVLATFIMFFSLYYFFKDAHAITKKIMVISPLPTRYEKELFKKFKEISLATLVGIFLTSIVQGILGGIGFAVAGVPSPLFWGTAVAFFSLVPVVGTAMVWAPAGIFLLLSGNTFGGFFMLAWGAGVVSTVDNFLRAYLIGGRTNTNQLLTFLAVFGGIKLFGLIGVLLGPLILNLFFTFLHIYEMEYDVVLHDGKESKRKDLKVED